MLTIWGRENSNNVRKVLWCAAELGLSYTHINAGGAFGKVNEESYRALNPNCARVARHGENRSGDRHAGKTLRRH